MKKLAIFILCLCLFGCGGSDHNNHPDSNSLDMESVKVTYTVSSHIESCYDAAYVTYLIPGEDFYDCKIDLPWSYTFDTRPGDYLYLYATPAHIADLDCITENNLDLLIKKDDTIISQGLSCTDDPNTYEINTYL